MGVLTNVLVLKHMEDIVEWHRKPMSCNPTLKPRLILSVRMGWWDGGADIGTNNKRVPRTTIDKQRFNKNTCCERNLCVAS